MRKLLLFCIFALLAVSTAFAQSLGSPSINITLVNQEPDPVSPGRYVDIRFKIFNTNSNSVATNMQVMLEPQYPFFLDPNEVATRSLGDLQGFGNSRNSEIVKFKVRVDEKAVEGSVPIKISYRHGSLDWFTQEFLIDVRTVDANLAIVSVDTVPGKIEPGAKASVNIKVKNLASSPMSDITMKLDLTFSEFLGTATDSIGTFNALPFAPLGSATEQKIYLLGAGEEQVFTYDLIAYSDAESKVYKVPIQLTYYDSTGMEFTKSDIIGLIVGVKPEMSVTVDTTELYLGKNSGDIIVKIVNKGFTDIKFLNVRTQHTDDFEIISSHEVYIGNVDSDDYETAEFNVYVASDDKNERTLKLPLTVEYRDANNNFYNDTYQLDVEILSPGKLGMQGGSGGMTWLIVLLLLGAVVFYFYRRGKRKTK